MAWTLAHSGIPDLPPASLSVDAELALRFTKDHVHVTRQDPPLRVLRAFGPLVHLHNLSGGVLSGDRLRLRMDVDAGAHGQVTTTGATRVYRCESEARQDAVIHIGAGGLLEYLPDAVIPFGGARYRQSTSVRLEDRAGLFWWETLAPGREASGELFSYSTLRLQAAIDSDRPLARERVCIEPSLRGVSSAARMGGYRYCASFYICKAGEPNARWKELECELAEIACELSRTNESVWGVSTLIADGLVVRALALNGWKLLPGLHRFWAAAKLRLYGLPAVPPRKVL
jgi:urease accessory protein